MPSHNTSRRRIGRSRSSRLSSTSRRRPPTGHSSHYCTYDLPCSEHRRCTSCNRPFRCRKSLRKALLSPRYMLLRRRSFRRPSCRGPEKCTRQVHTSCSFRPSRKRPPPHKPRYLPGKHSGRSRWLDNGRRRRSLLASCRRCRPCSHPLTSCTLGTRRCTHYCNTARQRNYSTCSQRQLRKRRRLPTSDRRPPSGCCM